MNKKGFLLNLSLMSLSLPGFALDSYYCSQNNGYINPGMSQDAVIAACGQPISKQISHTPLMKKVPVTQFIYNNKGSSNSFYGPWNVAMGNMNKEVSQPLNSGPSSAGVQLQIDVADDKILSVSINGGKTNAVSLCGGASITVGDAAGNVTNACGKPSMTNHTYIEVPIQSDTKPEIWTYQADEYQAPVSLTFVDGQLQSIN